MKKKKRLFYFEEACDAWIPVPEKIENIIDINILDEHEELKIIFKCFMMTDQEFNHLPEG